MLFFWCKNLAINIVSLVGHGSSVVRASLRNLSNFVYPTLPGPFSLVLMPGDVKYPTQRVNV